MKKIWHISDTHGYHNLLTIPNDIDIVIHSGDASNSRAPYLNEHEFIQFWNWFDNLPIKYKIYVPGNHDTFLEHSISKTFRKSIKDNQYVNNTYLLINDFIIIEDLKIWGSPVTPQFNNWAFMINRNKTHKVWNNIVESSNIVITHGPPKYILDWTEDIKRNVINVGDKNLLNKIKEIEPEYHLFGHVHNNKNILNSGIKSIANLKTIFSNGSVVTDNKFGKLTSNGNILTI